MLSKFIKIILFLSSYSPLFIIFAIQDSFNNTYIQIGLIVLAVVSVSILYIVLRAASSLEGAYEKIDDVNIRDGDSMAYIVTYLVPFLSIDFTETANTISMIFLLCILCILYMNSSLIYTNPIINFGRYHIFEVQMEDGKTIMLITKKRELMKHQQIKISQLDNNIYLGG